MSIIKIGDFTNQNATQPETSPEVICSQSASLRMLGAKLQCVFFTFRTRGWHLQRFQKTSIGYRYDEWTTRRPAEFETKVENWQ